MSFNLLHIMDNISSPDSRTETVASTTKIQWILRLAVFGEFLGHGVLAIQGKEQWVGWIQQLLPVSAETGAFLLAVVGIIDILAAVIVLIRPVPLVLLYMAVWGFWTALLRPLVGEPIWDFVERWSNWGAPLALLLLRGWPKNLRGWVE